MTSTPSHVGPVIFSVDSARQQLLTAGVCYTFRTTDRTTGETWARASRTGRKIADVFLTKVETVDAPTQDDLQREWAAQSGFETPEKWWDAIIEVHGEPETGHIYRCELTSPVEPPE